MARLCQAQSMDARYCGRSGVVCKWAMLSSDDQMCIVKILLDHGNPMSRRHQAENQLSWLEPASPFTRRPNKWPPRLKIAWADLSRHTHLQKLPITNHTPAENRLSSYETTSPYTRLKINWVDLSSAESTEHPWLKYLCRHPYLREIPTTDHPPLAENNKHPVPNPN